MSIWIYLLTPLLFLWMASKRFPAASYLLGALSLLVSVILVSIYGVFASLFLRAIGKAGLSQWATGIPFHYLVLYTSGVEFIIPSTSESALLNNTRPAVFISNHQTELDILMLATVFPKYCSVTAKSSLKRTPFLGWFMSLSGSVFINRANSGAAREAMKGAAEEIREKRQSVYIFPEGTRSYYKEPGLLPFKKGAFHLAVEAGVPIIPVVVANYSSVLYVQGWWYKPGKILCKVLDPIETKNLTPADVEDLTRNTRELMLKELIELTAIQRRVPMAVSAKQNPPVQIRR